jgi:hypothetical protein
MKLDLPILNYLGHSGKTPATNSTFRFCLGLFLLGLVLGLPTGITAWFDGLPWTGKTETIVLTAIVPFLLILGSKFLSLRQPILFLTAFLILKAVLFLGSPSSGWQIQITPNVTKKIISNFYQFQMFDFQERSSKLNPELFRYQASERDIWVKNFTSKDGYWVKTYATFWNKNASGVLQNPWTEKLDFPLDWVNIGPNLLSSWRSTCPSRTCLKELSPIIKIEGSLILPEGKRFALVAKGAQEGFYTATNESGESFAFLPANNFQEAGQEKYQLPKDGNWRISGKFLYEGKDWSLIPVLVEANGEITEDMGRGVLWQNWEDLSSYKNFIGLYKVLSFIFDTGIIFFLLAWTGWIFYFHIQQKIINPNLAIFSLLAACLPFLMASFIIKLFKMVGIIDATKVSLLGVSTIIATMGFLFFTYLKKDFRIFQADRIVQSIFLFFAPATLLFFANKWWYLLGKLQVWAPGDDWSLYQSFAYKIFVEGDWLKAGEGYFLGQPLHRYFIGLYHWLFGQSNFAQHMVDVWCVLGAVLILAKLMLKFRFSTFIIFFACTTYLIINFLGAYRYHFGRGLTDNHGMIFMMLAAWFLVLAREGGGYRIFLATLFGIIDFWIRVNHLIVIACLGFLIYEPMGGPTGRWREYWNRLKHNWTPLVCYWGGGILSIILICFRNWWLGGDFTIMQEWDFEGHTVYSLEFKSVYVILAGQNWPSFPAISGYVITFGVLIALLALVWNSKIFQNYSLVLSLSIVSYLFPLIIFKIVGYAPRYSIPLLPLAILSIAFFLNNLLEKYKYPKPGIFRIPN